MLEKEKKLLWTERTERFPHGLVSELASGENPAGIPFQLLIDLASSALIIKREGKGTVYRSAKWVVARV